MKKQINIVSKVNSGVYYYSSETMPVKESNLSRFLNYFSKNLDRQDVAGLLNLSGLRALDVACGKGELSNNYLSKYYKNIDAIDISAKLINIANKNKSKNVNFLVQDLESYTDTAIKKKIKYDSIYMLAILEHIQWPSEFLNKISKITKKGGHVIIEVPNVAWFPHRLSLLMGKFPVTAPTLGAIPGVYDEHIRFFTFDTLDAVLRSAGFKFVKFDMSGKFRYVKKIMPKLLSADIVAVYKK